MMKTISDFIEYLMDRGNFFESLPGIILGCIISGLVVMTFPIWGIPYGVIQYRKWRKNNE